MRSKRLQRPFAMGMATFLALVVSLAATAHADTWRGTAPFCNGECKPGETQIATSNCGDGACCWTGHKVLCRNSEPTCTPTQTIAKCYGILMVCDNGHYVGGYQPSWVSCAKYVCGMCLGFPW
ncbi:MAG: hypothetical protein ACOY8P_04900 [Thermodesulfobacteriota bacterium]